MGEEAGGGSLGFTLPLNALVATITTARAKKRRNDRFCGIVRDDAREIECFEEQIAIQQLS